MNRERSRQAFRRQCSAIDVKREVEIAEDFQGIDPGFEASSFITEQGGSRTYYGQEFP